MGHVIAGFQILIAVYLSIQYLERHRVKFKCWKYFQENNRGREVNYFAHITVSSLKLSLSPSS